MIVVQYKAKVPVTQQHTPTHRFEGDIIVINDKCFVLRYTNLHKPPYFSPKLLYECSKTIIAREDCIFLLELSKVLLLLTSICKLTFKAFNLSPLQSVETTKLISTVEPELGKTILHKNQNNNIERLKQQTGYSKMPIFWQLYPRGAQKLTEMTSMIDTFANRFQNSRFQKLLLTYI